MGVAARNVSGITLHAALGISKADFGNHSGIATEQQIAMWEGVYFLFIDEISMISCRFLF
jgi:hypothetical protein